MPIRADDSWEAWFDRYQMALLLFARQFHASPQDAEDAVQDGFIRFWKSRNKANDPTAYLFASVRSAAIDLRRSRQSRRKRELESAESGPAFVSPCEIDLDAAKSEIVTNDERRRLLESALAALPEEQREVLVLKTWSPPPRLTFAQIAAALHIPANTAASRYRYAIERLQAILSPEVTRD